MNKYTREEQAFIDGIEFSIDWNLPVPEEYYQKYIELTNKRGDIDA